MKKLLSLLIWSGLWALAPGLARASLRLLTEGGSSPVQSNPTTSDPGKVEVGSRPQKFKDLFTNDKSKGIFLDCQLMILPDSDFECLRSQQLTFHDEAGSPRYETVLSKKLNKANLTHVQVVEVREPEVLERMIQGARWQQTLDSKLVRDLRGVEAGEDYLMLFEEGFSHDYHNSLWAPGSADVSDLDFVEILTHFVRILGYIHSQGYAVLSFEIIKTRQTDGRETSKISRLECAVRLGQETGNCLYNSIATEPLVLAGDSALKADTAMDYYALGIYLYRSTYTQFTIKSHLAKGTPIFITKNEVLAMKKTGKFEFRKGNLMALALLTAFFLQDDRAARSDTNKISQLIKSLTDFSGVTVPENFEYDCRTDPLSQPEFQEVARRIVFLEAGKSLVNPKSAAQDQGLWAWKWWILGAFLLAVAIILISWLLRRDETVQKPLAEGAAESDQPEAPEIEAT